MAEAHEHDSTVTAKPPRPTEADAGRPAPDGQLVLFQAGEPVAEVAVSKARIKRLVGEPRMLSRMILGYADAAAKAKRTGKAHVISYVVTPDGKAEAVAETPAVGATGVPLEAALARARSRGVAKVADILKGSDMLAARDFGPLIGASHETVNAKRKRHEVLGLEGATRGVKYPRWQVTEVGLPLPGLARLFGVLGEQPWTVYRFLRGAHAELGGRTALDALKAGEVEAVVGIAENQAAGAFA